MGLQSYGRRIRRWVGLGMERVKRMWVRDEGAVERRAAGEHRWTWVWLGRDATDDDINGLVEQMQEEIARLPMPMGINDFMITVSAWGPRHDGGGEEAYLRAKQAGDDAAMTRDLAMRDQPKVVAIGDVARGHVIGRHDWSMGGVREQLRQTLHFCRPSRQWRIVHIALFSVGEAYLKLVAEPAS